MSPTQTIDPALQESLTMDPRDLSRVPANLRAHCYPKGVSGHPQGRPRGARASKVIERAETRLARRYVKLALDELDTQEGTKIPVPLDEQGRNLRHAMDKFVPDAGKLSDDGVVVPIFVIVPGSSVADSSVNPL